MRLCCLLLSAFCLLVFQFRIPQSIRIDRFLQTTNLRSVVMRVGGINLEPGFKRVNSALGMPAFALPIFFRHLGKNLRGGRAGAAKSVERRSTIALVILE